MAADVYRDEPKNRTLTHVLAVVGAGGALVGWLAVVGGIREYARFEAAGIPSPAQTASLLPRETLIADGLSALAPTLAIASVLGLIVYIATRGWVHRFRYKPITRYRKGALPPAELASVLVASAIIAGSLIFAFVYELGTVAAILTVGVVSVVAAIAFLAFRLGAVGASPIAAAATVAVVAILNGGAAAFIQPLTSSDGKFDTALVTRRGLEPVTGFYLTRSGGHVYVLVLPAAKNHAEHSKRFSILAVPESEVELVEIGPSYKLRDGRPVEPGAKVTKLPDPVGPTIYPPGSNVATSKTTNYSNTTTTINNTTTNNNSTNSSNSHNSTITTTTVFNQVAPTPLPELESVAQLFALDKIVPAKNHFCFAVGASNAPESLRLRFYAPTMPPGRRAFTQIQTTSAPRHGRALLTVPLSAAVRGRLRDGKRLPINVKVIATSPGRTRSQTAYHLELQEPGGVPQPRGATWERPPDFASCAGARPAPSAG